MQRIFQRAKRLISMCLVTLLVITSAPTIFPASARAEGDIITTNIDCRDTVSPKCGNIFVDTIIEKPIPLPPQNHAEGIALAVAAAIGAIIGSSSFDALSAGIATGAATAAHAVAVTAAPMAAAATHAVAVAAAPAMAVAAPVVIPVAATAAVGYVGYRVWEAHQNSQPKYSTQITTVVQN